MTQLHQRPVADPRAGSDVEALFKEARQRRRRLRMLWVVVALALVGCAVGIGFGFHVLSRPASQSRSAGTGAHVSVHLHTAVTLVYAFNDLRVIDADTGVTRTLPMPAPYGSLGDLGMVRVGGSLLLNRGNTAWLYPNGVTGSPRNLGPSDGVFQGPTRNEAWIWSRPCQQTTGCVGDNPPQTESVQLFDSSGTKAGFPVPLPGRAGWGPTGLATDAGIVLSERPAYGDAEEIWNPLTNHVERTFTNANLIGAAGDLVVSQSRHYCSGEFNACSVRITNLSAGTERTVHLPRGVSVSGATISPNHRTIALAAWLSRTVQSPDPKVIALIDVRTGAATVLPGSKQATDPNGGPMNLTWSTNGWLFADTVGSSVVRAWRPGASRARVLPSVRLPKVQLVNEDPSLIAR
jgi:hypothetical protein